MAGEPLCSALHRAGATTHSLYDLVSSALNTARWKKLQSEKEELERRFEEEARKLRWQQREELQVLEQRLREEYSAKMESLQEQHRLQLERVKSQHQHQVSSNLSAVEKQTMPVLSSGNEIHCQSQQEDPGTKLMTRRVYSSHIIFSAFPPYWYF